ncbi:phage tail assembly chaperone [Chania multitudinisentens]|nr:phage tail assembly chaperone [Chania multitudinisentens]
MIETNNVSVLLDNYPRAFDAIAMAYTRELMALREKN